MRVPFYRHGLRAEDADGVASVLASNYLSAGAVCRKVEGQLCDYFGVEGALLGNSWTNLAHATLMALGIGPGDEVILPSITFVSCANVVELTGATPILVDVDPDTLLIDVAAMERAITARTRVVMPVHLYGQMCDMRALRETVRRHGERIAIVEDCAHAFEATFDGDRPGRYSQAAIFSFYGTKNVTCGEGGAVVSNDPDFAAAVGRMASHGMSVSSFERSRSDTYRHWDVATPGIHGRLPDMLAALLPRQIAQVEEMRLVRERIEARYRAGLDPAIRLARCLPAAVSAFHLMPIHVRPAARDRMIVALNEAGVGVTVNFRSIHRLTFYREKYAVPDSALPAASLWGDGQISLPLFPSLSAEEQDHVIANVNAIFGKFAAE